ncbi:MAG: hypothetical protein PHW04_07360 [Candidatus Wallbacteria bacterium]|nr:hypothetical protein [Candidatus Wallbacteria bacterium]
MADKETLEKLNYSSSINSLTLAALVKILVKKGLIKQAELAEAFEEVKKKAEDQKF